MFTQNTKWYHVNTVFGHIFCCVYKCNSHVEYSVFWIVIKYHASYNWNYGVFRLHRIQCWLHCDRLQQCKQFSSAFNDTVYFYNFFKKSVNFWFFQILTRINSNKVEETEKKELMITMLMLKMERKCHFN